MNKNNENQLSLYIHWPYCETKCPYCDFNSHVNENINVNDWIKSYKNQLLAMKEKLIENDINFKDKNKTEQFLKQSSENGFLGLNGHRSIGGVRISNYNSISQEMVSNLLEFIQKFLSSY